MGLIKMNGVNYWGSAYGQGIIAPMIYSEEEIEVGVWTDSKPLYQKTWKFSSPLSLATNTWVDTPIPNAGMQRIVNGFANDDFDNGGVNQSNAFMYLSFAVNAPTYVRVLNARNATITITHITLQYTKTTDTAGSGTYTPSKALAVHYSTNEQVIGTWINNKPLYEKVVAIPNTVQFDNSYTYPHGITNQDFARIVNAVAYDSSSKNVFDMPVINNDGTSLSVRLNSTDIIFRGSANLVINNNRTLYVVIQYTKTTD